MKNKKFPRYFKGLEGSGNSMGDVIFIRIDNDKDYGVYYLTRGRRERSSLMNLKTCLGWGSEEIEESEAILMF